MPLIFFFQQSWKVIINLVCLFVCTKDVVRNYNPKTSGKLDNGTECVTFWKISGVLHQIFEWQGLNWKNGDFSLKTLHPRTKSPWIIGLAIGLAHDLSTDVQRLRSVTWHHSCKVQEFPYANTICSGAKIEERVVSRSSSRTCCR